MDEQSLVFFFFFQNRKLETKSLLYEIYFQDSEGIG